MHRNFLLILLLLLLFVAFGGLVVIVFATGSKVRGFDPDRGRWIFKGDKKSVAQLPSEGK
jgi:hypothetical protein